MLQLVRLLASWTVRRLIVFFVIALAVLAALELKRAYDALPAQSEIASLQDAQRAVEREAAQLRSRAVAAVADIEQAEDAALTRRLAAVRAEIAERERHAPNPVALAVEAAQEGGGALATAALARFRLELLRQEEAAIAARLAGLGRARQLQSLGERIRALDAAISTGEQRIARIVRDHPLLSRLEQVPILSRLEGPWQELRTTRERLGRLKQERQRTLAVRQAAQAAADAATAAYRQARQAVHRAEAPTRELRQAIADRQRQLEANWLSRLWRALQPALGTAAWITLGIIVLPPALKVLWFFVIAPAARRLPPVTIGRTGTGEIGWADARRVEGPPGSAVTRRIRLGPGEEALLRPEYLQSAPGEARASSRAILSWHIPLSSLAAGMVGLTRIVAEGDAAILVSAGRDLVDEIAVIDVPEGSSLVFRPRNLVGLTQRIDRPVRIERVWTLGRLASWLTLRLRHLVFHGPCVLIARGARGIALESAERGCWVSGAATLGWSGGLAHRIDRTETFLAFLTAKKALFNDRFKGPRGKVLYEQMPRAGAASGLLGRGLQGLSDGLLKVVGL